MINCEDMNGIKEIIKKYIVIDVENLWFGEEIVKMVKNEVGNMVGGMVVNKMRELVGKKVCECDLKEFKGYDVDYVKEDNVIRRMCVRCGGVFCEYKGFGKNCDKCRSEEERYIKKCYDNCDCKDCDVFRSKCCEECGL